MALMAKARVERVGRGATGACIALVALLVVTLVAMVAGRGIATFTADGIDLGSFLTGTTWNPHQEDASGMPMVGALPMIAGSFSVTLLSTLFALPIAFGSAISWWRWPRVSAVACSSRFWSFWWASRRWFTALSA